MKKNLTILLLPLFLSVFGQSESKGSDVSFKLKEYFKALTILDNFNGNVLVAQNGKLVLSETFNLQTDQAQMHVHKDSKFIMASVSKVFVRYAILKLVAQKKLNLTDKLSAFIPDFPNGDKITVEHLMYHKSGLPRELNKYKDFEHLPLAKIVELAKSETLQFEPGSQTLYSNVGYFLLHFIIDKRSPKGYTHFMKKDILKKMHLNNTGEYNAAAQITHFAYGFDKKDGQIVPIEQSSINRTETGNYYTTIEDLYHFSTQILRGGVVPKNIALKMFGQDSLLMQAGGRAGYRAYFYKNLKTDITFLFLSNFTDIPFQTITEDVIKIMEGKPYILPSKTNRIAIPIAEDKLKRYIGKFALEVDKKQEFTIEVTEGKLSIKDKAGEKTLLFAENEFTFFDNPDSKDSYIFTFNEKTNNYDLSILTEGIKLKTFRLE